MKAKELLLVMAGLFTGSSVLHGQNQDPNQGRVISSTDVRVDPSQIDFEREFGDMKNPEANGYQLVEETETQGKPRMSVRQITTTEYMVMPEYREYLKQHPLPPKAPGDARTIQQYNIDAYNAWYENQISQWCTAFSTNPEILAAKQKYKSLLNEFAMSCKGYSPEAKRTIKTMAAKLNGHIIKARTIFDLNAVIGPVTSAEYGEGTVYASVLNKKTGKYEIMPTKGIAGGACNISDGVGNLLAPIDGMKMTRDVAKGINVPHTFEKGGYNVYPGADFAKWRGGKNVVAEDDTKHDTQIFAFYDDKEDVLCLYAFGELPIERQGYKWRFDNKVTNISKSNGEYDQYTVDTQLKETFNGQFTGNVKYWGVNTYKGRDLMKPGEVKLPNR